ncbi:UbiA prenyltransferase family [Amylostereum chailletii]|nr:UbiA prenyltransferase family [Amylostereum chailletii]
MASALDAVASAVYTTFLFTKSDIKTMVIPISFFAVAAAPILTWSRLPHVIFWIWCMAFQFTLSNQTLSPEEDAINKSDRPIPSGRISLDNAIRLRWLSIPICLLLSACYSLETIYGCAGVIILTMLYDDRQWSTRWWFKNGLNGLGYASFELGATLIAGANRHALDRTAVRAVLASAGVIATTIHAQDFKDEDGDRAVGRRTIPILYPSFSRWSIGVTLLAWSALLSYVWALDAYMTVAFVSLAAMIGVRFYTLRTVPEDQITYYWYNVWLSMVHILPGYYRLFTSH